MTVTLSDLRALVRTGLRDSTLPVHVEDAEVDQAIRNAMTLVAGTMPLGEKWVSSAATAAANSDTATLDDTYTYHTIYAIRRNSDGYRLEKRTVEEMERLWWYDSTSASATPGDVTEYAMTEDEDGLVTLRFNVPAKASTALDVRRAVLPSDLEDDTDEAPISPLLRMAVVDYAVAELAGKLTKNELDQLRLDRGVVQVAMQRAAKAVHDEELRKARLEGVGRPLRFVG